MNVSLRLLKYAIYIEWILILALQLTYAMDIATPFGYAIGLIVIVLGLMLFTGILLNRVITRLKFQEAFLFLFTIIIVLFAYPLKQLWIYTDPTIMEIYHFASQMTDLSTKSIGGYLIVEYSALCMLMVGIYIGTYKKHFHSKVQLYAGMQYCSRQISMLLVVITFVLMVIVLFLMHKFGMYMGGGGVNLPFRMAGVILYSHLIFIPMLFLVSIILQPQKIGATFILVVSLLILSYIAGDMIVRLSRSSLLVVMMLLLGFVVASRPESVKKFMSLSLLAVLMTLLLIPLVTTLRLAQINDNWESTSIKEQYERHSRTVINLFAMRITGAENAGLAISNIDFDSSNALEVLDVGVVEYYTREVIGIPDDAKTGFTPSALGEAFVLFGLYGGHFAIALLPLLILVFDRLMASMLTFLYPLTFAFLFAFTIKAMTGGIFAQSMITLIGACVVAWFIDWLVVLRSKALKRKVYSSIMPHYYTNPIH